MCAARRAARELTAKRLTQRAESGAAIEHVEAVAEPHFHTGGVAPVPHVFPLRSRG